MYFYSPFTVNDHDIFRLFPSDFPQFPLHIPSAHHISYILFLLFFFSFFICLNVTAQTVCDSVSTTYLCSVFTVVFLHVNGVIRPSSFSCGVYTHFCLNSFFFFFFLSLYFTLLYCAPPGCTFGINPTSTFSRIMNVIIICNTSPIPSCVCVCVGVNKKMWLR